MYKSIIRPLLFSFNPEVAHAITFNGIKILRTVGIGNLVNPITNPKSLHMETEVCGIKFPNKVGIAAGLDKNAEVFEMFGHLGFGHVEVGTVTPKGQPGNPKPRSFRLPIDKGLINRMGFNNHGLDSAVKMLKKRSNKLIVGGNIGKNTATPNEDAIADYIKCFNGLYDHVDYITVNVSCPNVTNLHKLQDQDQLEKILSAIDTERTTKSSYKPVFLKISPDLNLNQIDETLEVVNKCNVDGIIASNTTVSREGLNTDKDKITSIANGGLSGLPIKDRSTEIIRYISEKTQRKLPIIGVGGIFTPQDALDKINAGASLVQVYTGFIYEGPTLAKRINKYFKNSLQK